MPLTLEDIARMSGVSRSTVSRVINDDRNVNEATRRKVWEVIQNINFQPNLAARGLAAGRTQVLGLVIPMAVPSVFIDPYFPLLIQGISSACTPRGYTIMLWLAQPDFEQRMATQILNNSLIDGVIVASAVQDDPIVAALVQAHSMPFVMVGRDLEDAPLSYIDVDNRAGAAMAVEYLLRQGHERVATITGPQNMVAGYDRFQGYLQALARYHREVDPQLVAAGSFTENSGYECMQALLPHNPDALFIASDVMAIGAMRAIQEAGLKIPGDVAIIGFDDIPAAALTAPPLTTVRQPIARCGSMAAEMLINMIANPPAAPRRMILPTELVLRGTCKLE